MALRINTNIPSVTALRHLNRTDGAVRKSLERLSTGLRINSAADDPSGLVISEQLRKQIASMKQALRNSQNASNMIGTAEAALDETHALLIRIREAVVFALNTGGNSPEQIDAEQDSVDNMISSIDRIAETTRFATRRLLDGTSAIKTTSTVGSAITDMNIQSVQFDGNSQLSFNIAITQVASRAGGTDLLAAGFGAASNGTVLRITGNLGTEDIALDASFTSGTGGAASAFNDAINALTGNTGIYASNGLLYSVDYGSDAAISLEVVSGTLTLQGGTDLTASSSVRSDMGVDVGGYINGASFYGRGNQIRVVSSFLTGDFTLAEGTDSSSALGFRVRTSGLVFQINDDAPLSNRERLGIRSTDSSMLGTSAYTVPGIGGNTLTQGGFLSSLVSGGSNDLKANPLNALRIVDAAVNDISDLRAYLGAFKSQTLDTNINSLAVAVENLAASESTIRDLDFAEETANYTRLQILYQSGISVLAQSNLMAQNVLTLLG